MTDITTKAAEANAADVAERQAALLSAALPYMQKYENKTDRKSVV